MTEFCCFFICFKVSYGSFKILFLTDKQKMNLKLTFKDFKEQTLFFHWLAKICFCKNFF